LLFEATELVGGYKTYYSVCDAWPVQRQTYDYIEVIVYNISVVF